MLDARTDAVSLSLDRSGGETTVDGAPTGATLAPLGGGSYLLRHDGTARVVTIERHEGRMTVWIDGAPIEVAIKTEADLLLERFGLDTGDAAAEREVRAPMPGLVLRVLAEAGEAVEAGQGLVVLEAMKMENELRAPAAGRLDAVHVAPGDAVGKNDLLLEIEPAAA